MAEGIQDGYVSYKITAHEELAIALVDTTHEIGALLKKPPRGRKAKDEAGRQKDINEIAEHLAEMFRGSTDLDILETLVKAVHSKMDEKNNDLAEEFAAEPDDTVEQIQSPPPDFNQTVIEHSVESESVDQAT